MNDRLPANLAYLLIYNPTLPPPANASRDDEDAQEEAHILFYTSRERVASRDRMLRQVGLAKALVNFSEIFTPGQGCDAVHSQGKRMISVSPEPDFWIHACVDLAKTPKPSKEKGKMSKGKDPPVPTYHHHEDSLHDLALRNHLLRGYEDFKLLHGTFTSVLKDHGSGGLQRQLERFFTPWAWRWDLEAANEFGAHLGLPLHPLNSMLAPLISSFFKDISFNATPVLLSPPYIIDPSQPSVAPYPPSLPAYLLSLVPPQGSAPHPKLNPRLDSTKGTRTIAGNGGADTSTTSNTFGFLSAAGSGMGDVMNVKKWSWPGALTFGKSRPASQTKRSQSADDGESASQTKVEEPDNSRNRPFTGAYITSKEDKPDSNAPDVATHVESGVDQRALDDAISSTNAPSQPDDSRPTVRTDVEAEVDTFEQVRDTADASPAVKGHHPDDEASGPSSGLALPSPDISPTGHPFSVLKTFLSEPSEPLVVQRRTVLHVSRSRIVFALLMDAGWLMDEADEPLQALGDKVSGFLEDVKRTIEIEGSQGEAFATVNGKTAPGRTRHIISSPHSIVLSSRGFPSTSSQFFENQELLARDADTIDVFSRSTNPQHWFVARRGLGFNKAGEKLHGDAYLETGNKEASLVDADNELVGAVRRWAHGED